MDIKVLKRENMNRDCKTKNLNKMSYNKIVEEWNNARKDGSISSLLVEFANRLEVNDKVLDIGCGTGSPVTKYLSERHLFVTGIDISEEMIKKAESLNLKNTTFAVIDFFDYLPKEKFAGIIGFDSFFHFEKSKQKSIYKKVSSMLKQGGYLLFTHGKYNGEIIDTMFDEEFYYSSLEVSEVRKLLKEAGFEIIKLIEDYKENKDTRELIVLSIKKL